MKTKTKGKVITGIAMAAIMLASVFVAMLPTVSAVGIGGNFNYIGAGLTETVLVGQNVQFNDTGANLWTDPENVRVQKFEDGVWYYYAGPWAGGKAYNVNWDPTLTLRATNTTAGTVNTSLAVKSPNLPLKLKVAEKEVSSLTPGTNLTIDTGGINLFDNDKVDLEIWSPLGKIVWANNQSFRNITVTALKAFGVATTNINTTGWKVGDYTFQIKTRPEYACGLSASSTVKTLAITTGEIDISAEKTTAIELETIKLTVTGVYGDTIWLNATPSSSHVLFVGGVVDTPASADGKDNFEHTIDEDGKRTYAVKFNDTGSYTIKVTVKGGPRDGDYDTVDISVEEKGVTFDMPSTVVIGERLTIKGTANTGERVTIAVEDRAYPELDRLVIDDNGEFEKVINTTTACGGLFSVPGSVRLKAFIDRPPVTPPYDDTSGETDDGTAVILMTRGDLTAELSTDYVAMGDEFTINGTANVSMSVDIVIVAPTGSGGSLIEPGTSTLPDTNIYYATSSVSETDDTFSKKVTVGVNVDNGSYLVVVLSKGSDNKYGLNYDNLTAALAAYSLAAKTQEQVLAILEDATYGAAGSDDLSWMGYIEVIAKPYRAVELVYNINNTGYNYIAWTGSDTTVSTLAEMIKSADAAAFPDDAFIAQYNTATGTWAFYFGDDTGTNFALQQYDVVCVRVASEVTFWMPIG